MTWDPVAGEPAAECVRACEATEQPASELENFVKEKEKPVFYSPVMKVCPFPGGMANVWKAGHLPLHGVSEGSEVSERRKPPCPFPAVLSAVSGVVGLGPPESGWIFQEAP